MSALNILHIMGLLEKANSLGCKVSLNDGELVVNVLKDKTIDPAFLNELKSNKDHLIEYFKNHPISGMAARPGENGSGRISRRREGSAIPLSYNQEQLWIIDRQGGSVQYQSSGAFRLSGDLDGEALSNAFAAIVRRHEVLRTVLVEEGGGVVQRVLDGKGWRPGRHDSRGWNEDRLSRLVTELVSRPFDLSMDYLLRVDVIDVAWRECILIVTVHHIASDAWSMPIILSELRELYGAYQEGREAQLQPLTLQYGDYAIWQRNYLSGGLLDRKIEYWKQQLKGVSRLELPTDHVRLPGDDIRGGEARRLVGREIKESLLHLSQEEGVTLYMLLLSIWKILLYRYSGQENIVVGSSIAGRQQRELEGLVGYFVNTLALRTDLSGDPTFAELLGRVKETTLSGFEHQEVPFGKVVEALGVDRAGGINPLFGVMFVLDNAGGSNKLELGRVELRQEETGLITSKFDLTLTISEQQEGLQVTATYRRSLYERETIDRMLEHYDRLLGSVLRDRNIRISELEMMGAEELGLLETYGEGSRREYAKEQTPLGLFEEQVVKSPTGIAVVDGDRKLSYGDLDREATRLGNYLRKEGVKPGDPVGMLMRRGLEAIVCIVGIWKAGGAYVPVDPGLPEQRIAYMLEDAGTGVVIDEALYAKALAATDTAGGYQKLPDFPREKGALAYVMYTSGSTGAPKGVEITQENLLDYIFGLWSNSRIEECRRFALVSTLAADLGNTVVFGALLSGGELHVLGEQLAADGWKVREYFRNNGIDCVKIVPSHWKALRTADGLLLPQRLLIFGGEALGVEEVEDIRTSGWKGSVINHYGPTETTIGKLLHEVRKERLYNGRTIPIGRPFGKTRIYVLDGRRRPSPIGVGGELFIGGSGVGNGYRNQRELTDERFIPDVMRPGQRLYRTGDRVRWLSDGNIEYLGRTDDQVKVRGYRVELGEVEQVLRRAPGVQEAAVVLREKGLVGYVTTGGGWNQEEVMAWLQGRLPDYMIPGSWVELQRMPLTANGKLDRRALPEPGLQQTGGYAEARTEHEQGMVEIWKHLLELEQVGIDDNFFTIGGHSLLAIRLISALRERLGLEVTIGEVFEEPTIRGLAGLQAKRQSQSSGLPALEKEERPLRIPLSFGQERIWLIDRLEGSVAYHVPSVLRIRGMLDVAALEGALRGVVDRHEVLRTVFRETDGQVFQQVLEEKRWRLQLEEGGKYTQERLQDRIEQLTSATFDLSQDHLLRANLISLAPEEHVLVVVLHHIASDGWSVPILVHEIGQLYQALREGREARLEPLPAQYADYAIWQRKNFAGALLEGQLEYWKRRLAGLEPLQLPTDYARPAVRTMRGSSLTHQLGKQLSEDIAGLGREEAATLFMVLLSAFNVLLYRYSGHEDICVGTAIAGRTQKKTEGLIGFFVNTLALRSDLRDNPSFAGFLRRVKDAIQTDFAHQEAPFERVVEAVVRQRDLSRNPVFQVMFDLQQATPAGVSLEGMMGVAVTQESAEHTTSKFDLSFTIMETTEGLQLGVEYSTDLFDRSTIGRMARHYERLLCSAVRDRDVKIGQLGMLAEDELRLLEEYGRGNRQAYPVRQTLPGLFSEQVLRGPEAVAVADGGERLSYKELDRRSDRLANYLRKQGVGVGSLVPVCMQRSAEMIVGMLGILKAGGAYVPVDPSYPIERIRYMIEDTAAEMAVASPASRGALPQGLRVVTVEALSDDIGLEKENARTAAGPGDPAYVIYTSGSTGLPKGVVIEHRSVLNLVSWHHREYDTSAESRATAMSGTGFDAFGWEVWPYLLTGASVFIVTDDQRLSAAELLRFYIRNSITHSFISTALVSEFIRESKGKETPLRFLLTGGDRLHPTDMVGLDFELVNNYGPTENTVVTLNYWLTETDGVRVPPVGRPIFNISVYIMDKDGGLCPLSVGGEICIGGDGLARGYLNRPELTAEKFVADPHRPGGRIYRTGDVGRWLEGGTIEFLGRRDDQVKIRGFRVELGEIENVLREAPGIRDCVVVLRQESLVGYVAANKDWDREEVTDYLRSRLPEHMVPALWVALERLPLTANGKIDRRELPDPGREVRQGYADGRSEQDRTLAGIWQQLLEIERIGIDDNFFELGGHSLLAARAASAIRAELGIELPVRELFRHPTIRGLSDFLDTRTPERSGLPPISAGKRPARIPLSYSQERLWLVDQLEGSRSYHVPAVYRVRGRLDVAALEGALSAIVDRHEVLRTVFEKEEGQLCQRVLDKGGWHLEREEVHTDEGLRDRIGQLVAAPFDLSRDHPLRAHLIRRQEEEHVLVVVVHHIAADGWSVPIFVREFTALYEALRAGRMARLEALPVQYADFSIWQRRYIQGDLLERQLVYWSGQLRGVSPLDLPHDHPRPAVQSTRGSSLYYRLDQQLTEEIQQLAREEGMTLFMVLLAAFKVLLYRYSGQQDICVGSAIAGRIQRETEGLIGFFVNALALRTDLGGNPVFAGLLARVKETTLSGYENQAAPFDLVVDKVMQQRDLSRSPVFQVMFDLQHTKPSEGSPEGLSGVAFEQEAFDHGTSKFDISFTAVEDGKGLGISIEYCTDLYLRTTIERMAGHYERLLRSVVRDRSVRIDQVEMLSDIELKQLRAFEEGGQRDLGQQQTVVELFSQQVLRSPDAMAVIYGGQRLSFLELDQRSGQLGDHLRQRGIGVGMLVPICVERSVEMIVGMLGIMKAGAAYVPVDAAFPKERIEYILKDSAAALVVSCTGCRELLPEGLEVVSLDEEWRPIGAAEVTNEKAGPGDLAYVIYTSGSTGRPKGVLIEHRSLANYLENCLGEYLSEKADPGGSFAHLSYTFDASLTGLFVPLISGRPVVLSSRKGADVFIGEEFRSEGGYDLIKLTPAHLGLLEEEQRTYGGEVAADRLVVGGEALLASHIGFLYEGDGATEVINEYGPTEATVGCAIYRIKTAADLSALPGNIPIGRPMGNMRIYITDSGLGRVPLGVPGEICIGGAGLARGYLNAPELTAERFVSDPYRPGERIYRTGDVARWLGDGNLEYLGRRDDQVKLRGYRVELGEIESVLNGAPGVRTGVVALREGSLVGYVLPEGRWNRGEVADHLRRLLPEYMVPGAWVELEDLPLTANGKIDRKALPDPEAGAASGEGSDSPRNALEVALTTIWMDSLKIGSVGIRDNFFELGGHSLPAARVVSSIRKQLGMEIAIGDIFDHPTIEALAARLSEGLPAEESERVMIRAAQRPERIPLSYGQERLWFIDQMEGSVAYHAPAVLRIAGPLDRSALERALGEIVDRHEALRTVFGQQNGEPYQRILDKGSWRLGIIDKEEYRRDEAALAAAIEVVTGSPFDLSSDHKLRAELIVLDRSEHLLVLVLHHIASDVWSASILVHELEELYNAELQGRQAVLRSLPVQYADYAIWQRSHLEGMVLSAQLKYWQKQLEGLRPLNLPTDRPRRPAQRMQGASLHYAIDKQLADDLRRLSREEGVTMYMTLLSAFKILLYRYTDNEDICVGSAIVHSYPEVEGVIGFFGNMLALRSNLGGNPSFISFLQRVKETTLNAYAHQEVPFEKVVSAVTRERDMYLSPLFQVMFDLQQIRLSSNAQIRLAGLSVTKEPSANLTSKFDLSFSVSDLEDDLHIDIEYCTDLYLETTIVRMMSHYEQLLRVIADNPLCRVGDMMAHSDAAASELVGTQGNEIDESNLFDF